MFPRISLEKLLGYKPRVTKSETACRLLKSQERLTDTPRPTDPVVCFLIVDSAFCVVCVSATGSLGFVLNCNLCHVIWNCLCRLSKIYSSS